VHTDLHHEIVTGDVLALAIFRKLLELVLIL
jgi:hypothetical protein